MPKCFLCQLKTSAISGACSQCLIDLPWNTSFCQQCALPLAANGVEFCGQCLSYPPLFSMARTAFCYQFPINRLIMNFKDKKNPALGKSLSRLLGRSLCHDLSLQRTPPELLIPVPSHQRSLDARGYNPAQVIATSLSKILSIPVRHDLIIKRQPSAQQKELTADERRVNLENAFVLTANGSQVIPKHYRVAIIDDVITTGATANSMTKTLLKGGIQEVIIWAIARTP